MHEEPLLLIPEEMRTQLCDEINRGQDGDYRMKIEGELSFVTFYFQKPDG